jgi:hypothetical protein
VVGRTGTYGGQDSADVHTRGYPMEQFDGIGVTLGPPARLPKSSGMLSGKAEARPKAKLRERIFCIVEWEGWW